MIYIEGETRQYGLQEASYSHTISAIGGSETATFTIRNKSKTELGSLFNRLIGRRVRVSVNGITAWTGYIARLDLSQNGVGFRRSLEYSQFVNAVKVFYSSDIGERKNTGWIEDSKSINLYSRAAYIASLGGATDDQAQRYAAQILAERSEPVARLTGAASGGDKLTVTCIGDWGRAGLLYREKTEHASASDLVATLAGEVGFRLRRITKNQMIVKVDCTFPQRYNDLFRSIAEQGDDDLRRYRIEVIENSIIYEPVSLRYDWSNGTVKLGGQAINPIFVKAGATICADSSGVSGCAYIQQARYSVESGLQLSLLELTGRAAAIVSQIQH